MRFARLGLLIFLLSGVSVWGQQTQTTTTLPEDQTTTTPPAAPKDTQAISVIGQTLAAGGGTSTLMSLADYTASGTVIYHQDQDVQGTVTLSGLGLGEFRQDASLPTGVRSFSIANGQAAMKEGGITRQLNFNYQIPLMTSSVLIPCWQLGAALNNPMFGLSYKGVTEIDGYAVYDIRIQLLPPGPPDPNGVIAEYFGADFFIDTSTFQVRMTQDVVNPHLIRKIRYSNYASTNGIPVPFSIDEEINGKPSQSIRLNQIGFNAGLQESAFGL
jgi:hypothetical protein